MDITFNTNGDFKFSEDLSDKFKSKISKKLGNYTFISSVRVNLRKENDLHLASLSLNLKKGEPIFADSETDKGLTQAFDSTMDKVLKQIEKYKDVHYHSK